MIALIAVVITLLVAGLIIVPFVLLGGWIAMLCFGALAHIFGVAALSLGFWQSTLVALILEILL